jgi:hypothetical protein
MTAATLRAETPTDDDLVLDTNDIHARAWAMVEAVVDSVPGRMVLLHAAAMLMASVAHEQPDPITSCDELLAEVLQRLHLALAAALARRLGKVVLVSGVGMVVAHCLHGGLARSG